jgi:multidrug transporter EmrE-like cation transporter
MDWFQLTLLLAVTGTALTLSLRAITPETNPFLFMAFVTAFAGFALLSYCGVNKISPILEQNALILALLAGVSIAVLDLAFIFMFRHKAPVSTAMPLFRVSSIALAACIGWIVFQENPSLIKLTGIVTACLAVYLLNSKPKGEVK